MTFELKESEKRIGYTFRNKELLITAFTHSTYANVHGGEDNERLEFLGDSVLQMVVSEALYFRKEKDRALREGEMTVLRQMMVRKEALLDAVERLGLKDFLLIEGGAANVGDKTVSSLFETVTAAIYLDSGYRAAKKNLFRTISSFASKEILRASFRSFCKSAGNILPDTFWKRKARTTILCLSVMPRLRACRRREAAKARRPRNRPPRRSCWKF